MKTSPMNRPMLPPPRRRLASALLVAVGLALGSGCEEPDETVRGAGSIDVPVQDLSFQPSDVPAPTPPLEDLSQSPAPDHDETAGAGRD